MRLKEKQFEKEENDGNNNKRDIEELEEEQQHQIQLSNTFIKKNDFHKSK